jgi:hypothetical protein
MGILGMRWKEIRDNEYNLEGFEGILRRGTSV